MSTAQGCTCFTLTEIPSGLSAPKWRTVRRAILPTHQRQQRLWNSFPFYLRTVRPPLADRPQFKYSIHQRRTSLDNFLDSTADCPRPSGGPSAVHPSELPETTSSLDKPQASTADRPLPYSGLSATNPAKQP